MNTQLGKNFIVTLMAVVLALGGLTWLSERAQTKDAPQVAAMTEDTQLAPMSPSAQQQGVTSPIAQGSEAPKDASQAKTVDSAGTSYEEGYRSGYLDAEQHCAQSQGTTRASSASARRTTRYYSTRSTRRYYSRRPYARSGVAGVSYSAPPRGHSVRNMILTIAAPAALAAGIGGIAGGGKGAGIGALIGGGGGALYYLIKHRQ